jgi:hypothetical protein
MCNDALIPAGNVVINRVPLASFLHPETGTRYVEYTDPVVGPTVVWMDAAKLFKTETSVYPIRKDFLRGVDTENVRATVTQLLNNIGRVMLQRRVAVSRSN